jgi:hypothetical protein
MPLMKSGSKKSLHENIREMMKSGHPQKQAIAASLANQRKYKKMAMGGMVELPDEDDNIDGMRAGEPVYPMEDAADTLSFNVEKENGLAEHLQKARYAANQERTLVPDTSEMVKGNQFDQHQEEEPMSGDETPEVLHDGTEEPMSMEPKKPSALDHAMIGGVPMGSMLSKEAKEAIMKKRASRRFY